MRLSAAIGARHRSRHGRDSCSETAGGIAMTQDKVEIILANANHQALDRAVVEFIVPEKGRRE